MKSRIGNIYATTTEPASTMARINTSLQGGASLPEDASVGRKRQRGGGDSSNKDADNDRASKRSRKEKARDDTRSKKGPSSDEPRRSNRDRNSGDGNNWWQTTATGAPTAAESPAGSAAKTTKSGKAGKGAGKAVQEKKAKTGRPAKPAGAAEVTDSAQASKPAKATKAARAEARAEKAAGPADTATDKPRRGRPRASNASTEAAAEPPTTDSPAPKKAKNAKKAKTGTAQSPRANKKNKKSGDRVTAGALPTIASPQPQPRAKPKPTQTVEVSEEQEVYDEDDVEDDDDDDNDELQQPFRQLVPRTRLVPLATMTNKWAPLDRDAIAAVQSLLDECARPVLARLGSSSEKKDRQDAARQAVAGVTRRLRSKLVKGIPFPTDANGAKSNRKPAKKLKAADATRVSFLSEPTAEMHALQSQLTPLQHAVALLASERRREEAALADEYAQLRALETNAQAELRTWRERQRRQHVLADGSPEAGLFPRTVGPEQDGHKDDTNGLFSDSFDGSVVDLTSLGNHMESVRGNLQQIDGVVAAMARSRAALQDVLGERLSGDQYERVLLGR